MFENATIEEGGAIIAIHIPMQFKRRGGRKEIILPPDAALEKPTTPLQLAVARAFRWQAMLDSDEVASMGELANLVGMDKSYLGKILRFTLLAPDIVEATLSGKESDGLSMTQLLGSIPALWEEQRRLFGFAEEERLRG